MIDKQAPIEDTEISNELEQSVMPPMGSESHLEIDWWKAYGDAQLDVIIEKALSGSPAIKSIEARYAQANSVISAARAGNMPQISAYAALSRERFSENYIFPPPLGGNTYSLYQTGITLDYTFDFWDARASRIRSAKYSALAQKAYIDAVKLALASGICAIYLSWHYDEERVRVLNGSRKAMAEERKILEKKLKQGLIDATDLYAKTADVSAIMQEISTVRRSIEGKKESISILGGFMPSYADTLVAPKIRDGFEVPLPKEIYLDLIAHRADVTVQKYIVLSKSQNIENAKAQFYPNISLSGLIAFTSFDLSKLFEHSSYAPAGGAALSLPLLDGGAREANLQANVSDYNSSVNDYNNAIIKAANEVVGVLKRSQFLASQMRFHEEDLDAKNSSETVALKRFNGGVTDKLPYLKAKVESCRGELGKIALNEEKAALQIELIKALGGGYSDQKERSDADK
jgi:NodT family efflux transporter outer membrane factor (OMF) lipoprotein